MSTRAVFRRLSFALALSFVSVAACAGVINETDGVGLKGYDPVAYFSQHKAVAGSKDITSAHDGVTYRFATVEDRDAFAANPEHYLPQYGGFCAYGVAQGAKADIDPNAFTIVDDKLYLNHDKSVQSKWNKDIPGFIGKAEANWPEVQKSTKVIR